jgi:hypothetical protein
MKKFPCPLMPHHLVPIGLLSHRIPVLVILIPVVVVVHVVVIPAIPIIPVIIIVPVVSVVPVIVPVVLLLLLPVPFSHLSSTLQAVACSSGEGCWVIPCQWVR